MADFSMNAVILHEAFPDPTPALRTYLQAYEALGRSSNDTRQAALDANRSAWRAMSEDERQAVDDVLDARPLHLGAQP